MAAATQEDKLLRMANQIASFFRSYPDDEAVAGIHKHIEAFWTPKMVHKLEAALPASARRRTSSSAGRCRSTSRWPRARSARPPAIRRSSVTAPATPVETTRRHAMDGGAMTKIGFPRGISLGVSSVS